MKRVEDHCAECVEFGCECPRGWLCEAWRCSTCGGEGMQVVRPGCREGWPLRCPGCGEPAPD